MYDAGRIWFTDKVYKHNNGTRLLPPTKVMTFLYISVHVEQKEKSKQKSKFCFYLLCSLIFVYTYNFIGEIHEEQKVSTFPWFHPVTPLSCSTLAFTSGVLPWRPCCSISLMCAERKNTVPIWVKLAPKDNLVKTLRLLSIRFLSQKNEHSKF